jgi:hypothetical protein
LSLYLDASALLPAFIPEPSSATVAAFLRAADDALLVGTFAAAEVASAVSRLARTRALTSLEANSALLAFDEWCAIGADMVEVEPIDVRLAAVFVRRFDLMLRAPDALHIAVCQRLGSTLVTLDLRLAAAARDLGVEVSVP